MRSGRATAQINGTVKDQSGEVLPASKLQPHRPIPASVVPRSAMKPERLPSAEPGCRAYRLEAALPGFRTYVQTGIVLQVNSSPAINAILEVGQVSEQVECGRMQISWRHGCGRRPGDRKLAHP